MGNVSEKKVVNVGSRSLLLGSFQKRRADSFPHGLAQKTLKKTKKDATVRTRADGVRDRMLTNQRDQRKKKANLTKKTRFAGKRMCSKRHCVARGTP